MQYKVAVHEGKEWVDALNAGRWCLGKIADEVEPIYKHATVEWLAKDIGIDYQELRHYLVHYRALKQKDAHDDIKIGGEAAIGAVKDGELAVPTTNDAPAPLNETTRSTLASIGMAIDDALEAASVNVLCEKGLNPRLMLYNKDETLMAHTLLDDGLISVILHETAIKHGMSAPPPSGLRALRRRFKRLTHRG
jgi:hypothetical protein